MSEAVLGFYTVYENPQDFPGKFVVRIFTLHPRNHPAALDPDGRDRIAIIRDAEPFCVAESLEEARAQLPRELYNLGRHADDDPIIVEVWI